MNILAVLADLGPRGYRCRFHAILLYFIVSTRRTRGSLCPSSGEQRNFSESSMAEISTLSNDHQSSCLVTGRAGNHVRESGDTQEAALDDQNVRHHSSKYFFHFFIDILLIFQVTRKTCAMCMYSVSRVRLQVGCGSFEYYTLWVRHNHGCSCNWVRLQLGGPATGCAMLRGAGCKGVWLQLGAGCK